MKTPWPSLMGIWALIWRATLLAPLMGVITMICFTASAGRYLFPILVLWHLWNVEWFPATACMVAWLVAWQLMRFSWFKTDRRDFLNEGENV